MAWVRAVSVLFAAVVVGLVAVSGGSSVDPRTPPALPGEAVPFLGTAVAGSGGLTASVDAYGDVVDVFSPGPAGRALVDNPSDRQAAGSVEAATGIVPRLRIGGGPARALWEADAVRQRYLPGTNVVRTVAEFGAARAVVTVAATEAVLAVRIVARGAGAESAVGVDVDEELRCRHRRHPARLDFLCRVGRAGPDDVGAGAVIRAAAAADRRWLARARPLDRNAPRWAVAMYERSLLVLRALTDRRTGAAAAGARDGWTYVWPRDAATAALALGAAGYGGEGRRVLAFSAELPLSRAARFHGDGTPVPGRGPQGDAPGWLRQAAADLGFEGSVVSYDTEGLPDYWEGDGGRYLGNAISLAGDQAEVGAAAEADSQAAPIRRMFGTPAGLVREAYDPASGLDSAAAWAVRPFSIAPLYPIARRTLLRLLTAGTPYGITPGAGWHGGSDPWSAPTAWSAWAFAGLAAEEVERAPTRARADRAAALRLLAALRRSATAAGALPERVDARSGVPRSTTPLAWSHAFAALALSELWPPDLSSSRGGEAGDAR